ncbi:MAG TPA: LysR family transcriptional regulator [Rubellimicrobium sp.]|nr:LysR family transcriptional regulator [Rubellimicrobium sp.]
MDRLAADRMFAAVVEAGSFAGAAQRLGTSSGQASKLVSRLEAELGVRLLHRTTRALAPTEAGQAYFDRLRSLLDEFDALDAEVRDQGREPRGTVRLTAPLSFGTLRLAGILADFAKAHPRIGLDATFTDRLVSLVDEGFDLAVRVGRPGDSSLVARKLGEAQIVTLAAPAYLAARGTPQVPDDLQAHDCIKDTNLRDPHRWTFRDGRTVTVTGRLTFSNAGVCLSAAEAGLGVAYMPDFVAAESLRAGRVVQLLQGHEDAPIGIFALTPSGRHLAAKVRVLIDALVQGLRTRA